MDEFYHVCPLPLAPGSVILPGNWGRIVNSYTANNGSIPIFFREYILEEVRKSSYPDKPSRLKSCFVLPTPGGAATYRDMRSQSCLIYKVHFDIEDCVKHIGGWDYIYPDPDLPLESAMKGVADAYWKHETNDQHRNGGVEIIAESAITIVERIG